MKHTPLFESDQIRLTPIDPEKDSASIAAWTNALENAAKLREDQPARPMVVSEVKKLTERWQKEADESHRQFLFAIRRRATAGAEDDPIIGVLRIMHIEWVHGAAYMDLITNDTQTWDEYAREVLDLALRFAFEELSLFRVTAVIPAHDEAANHLFQQARFTLEVRQSQAVYWNRQAWDKLYFGLLRPEWKMQQLAEVAA
jgi:RimJ/RimL family protein N-acetyltransferase